MGRSNRDKENIGTLVTLYAPVIGDSPKKARALSSFHALMMQHRRQPAKMQSWLG